MANQKKARTSELRKVNESAKEAGHVIASNKSGRPPKYHPHFVMMVEACSLIGSTNSALAAMFGVDDSTLSGWMKTYPLFSSAIKRGRDAADEKVETALLARAMGYSHPEEKIFCTQDGRIRRAKTTAQYPPDATSMIFWLKNRRPEQWRDRRDEMGVPTSDAAAELRAALAEMDATTDSQQQGGKQ